MALGQSNFSEIQEGEYKSEEKFGKKVVQFHVCAIAADWSKEAPIRVIYLQEGNGENRETCRTRPQVERSLKQATCQRVIYALLFISLVSNRLHNDSNDALFFGDFLVTSMFKNRKPVIPKPSVSLEKSHITLLRSSLSLPQQTMDRQMNSVGS